VSSPFHATSVPPPPRLLETLTVFVLTIFISFAMANLVRPLVAGSDYRILVSWASHIPQLLLPWLWYRVRVAPALPAERRRLVRWPPGSTRPLLIIALWMVGLKLLGSIVQASVSPQPQWVKSGFLPIVLILLYQGLFVGLSEEMMIRPALHLPLGLRLHRGVKVGRIYFSHAWVITSLLFGIFHLPNALLGQPLTSTIMQAVLAAVVGGIIGYYYERTDNYLGAAALHSLLNVAGYVPILLLLLLK
jgi:membrane protease YdiL (CAAX protease family)